MLVWFGCNSSVTSWRARHFKHLLLVRNPFIVARCLALQLQHPILTLVSRLSRIVICFCVCKQGGPLAVLSKTNDAGCAVSETSTRPAGTLCTLSGIITSTWAQQKAVAHKVQSSETCPDGAETVDQVSRKRTEDYRTRKRNTRYTRTQGTKPCRCQQRYQQVSSASCTTSNQSTQPCVRDF